MNVLWKYLRPTPVGAVIRQMVISAYRLRELLLRELPRPAVRARMAGAYRYWINKRSLSSHIASERLLLEQARHQQEAFYSAPGRDPLVSVIIPTWNRAELLIARTLPSVLAQTHGNLEIIVVGDCCTDNTAEMIASIGDPRVIFFNLPYCREKKKGYICEAFSETDFRRFVL